MTVHQARVLLLGVLASTMALLGVAGAGAQPTSTETLDPPRLGFPDTAVGERSAVRTLLFTTTGTVTVDLVRIVGQFEVVAGGTCGPRVTIGPGPTGCSVRVVFAPTSAGSTLGTVTVAYGGDLAVQSSLFGTATAPTTSTSSSTTTSSTTTTGPQRTSTTRTTAPPTSTSLGPAPTATTEPAQPSTTTSTTISPPPRGGRVTLDATVFGGGRAGPPGIGLTVVGSGYPSAATSFAAGPAYAQAGPQCSTIYFFLDGRRLGSARPDGVGDIHKDGISVPGDTEPGRHQVTSSCRTSGTPELATTGFDVTDASIHRTVLATSLPQADQVDFGLDQLLLSALAVAALLVLIAFPAELFNTTLEEHYDEVRGWVGLKPRPLGGGSHHGLLLATFLLLSGPLWFAMQPSSRVDGATALGALGLSLATGVVVVASDIPAAVHVRRRYRERARPIALPGSVVIAVACVALSRAVGFQPGYFYGLVGGLALSRTLARAESGRIAARTAVALLILSVGSWVALLPVSAAAAESGDTFGTIVVENLLGGVFWAALDSLVIAMLPLRLLQGAKVIGWSRATWAALYGATLFAFVHILLRPSTGYVSNTSVSPPFVVVGLFVGFAVFSFAFWGYFRFRPVRPRSAPG